MLSQRQVVCKIMKRLSAGRAWIWRREDGLGLWDGETVRRVQEFSVGYSAGRDKWANFGSQIREKVLGSTAVKEAKKELDLLFWNTFLAGFGKEM
jgi:hypothetical protein